MATVSSWGVPSNPSNTPLSALIHRAANNLLAAFSGNHWPTCQQPSLPLLHPSSLQPHLPTRTKSLVVVGARRQTGMECKQMVHPHTIYWASDPLRPGRFEVEGLEGGMAKSRSTYVLKPKSNLLTFPFQATSIQVQDIFNPFLFCPAKHESPCSLHDETMSTKHWQEALFKKECQVWCIHFL